jgi:catechol 2,3-dioxygenase-like lactoylglutathione lyase family enzyme
MIERLDHLVLTVGDLDATVAFYAGVLGMRHEIFGDGRSALRFGDAKINLHQVDRTFDPKAAAPTPGSADLCFVASVPLREVQSRLASAGVPIEEGPIARTGALGPIVSVYLRDPDGNLIEISTYEPPKG